MNTIGWLFLLAGGFLVRAVAKGRSITDLPGDIGDAFTAAVELDGAGFTAVLARTGSSLDPVAPVAGATFTTNTTGTESTGINAGLLAAMRKRGGAAKGYRLGATGPDYYDCSGLVWRSVMDIGVYSGPRFTTATFAVQGASWTQKVTAPVSGDIVLWPGHHMGVMSGGATFYSALNSKDGIKDIAVKGITGTPHYYRVGRSVVGAAGPGVGVAVP